MKFRYMEVYTLRQLCNLKLTYMYLHCSLMAIKFSTNFNTNNGESVLFLWIIFHRAELSTGQDHTRVCVSVIHAPLVKEQVR